MVKLLVMKLILVVLHHDDEKVIYLKDLNQKEFEEEHIH